MTCGCRSRVLAFSNGGVKTQQQRLTWSRPRDGRMPEESEILESRLVRLRRKVKKTLERKPAALMKRSIDALTFAAGPGTTQRTCSSADISKQRRLRSQARSRDTLRGRRQCQLGYEQLQASVSNALPQSIHGRRVELGTRRPGDFDRAPVRSRAAGSLGPLSTLRRSPRPR